VLKILIHQYFNSSSMDMLAVGDNSTAAIYRGPGQAAVLLAAEQGRRGRGGACDAGRRPCSRHAVIHALCIQT